MHLYSVSWKVLGFLWYSVTPEVRQELVNNREFIRGAVVVWPAWLWHSNLNYGCQKPGRNIDLQMFLMIVSIASMGQQWDFFQLHFL